jgi:hypothetical protein
MSSRNTNYPYYAQWWFFVGVLLLSWMTPVTSHWKTYFFGEQTEALLARTYDDSTGRSVRKYVFKHQGYPYFSEYKEVINSATMPVRVSLYFNKDYPSINFVAELDFLYYGKRLIFPVLFQMLMVAFFFLVRTKEYES